MGNKCERGAELDRETKPSREGKGHRENRDKPVRKRASMLFEAYPGEQVSTTKRGHRSTPDVGVLEQHAVLSTFFKALGFKTLFSAPSNQAIYEKESNS